MTRELPTWSDWCDRASSLGLRRRGGELVGPCPSCGGHDRFHVRPRGDGGALVGCRGCIDGGGGGFGEVLRTAWPDYEPQHRRQEATRRSILATEERSRARRAEQAAVRSQSAIQNALDALAKTDLSTLRETRRRGAPVAHPYLRAKGHPDERWPTTSDHRLVVPMLDISGKTQGVQYISETGEKRFEPGSTVTGTLYPLVRERSGGETWLCEGLATALSVREAIRYAHTQPLLTGPLIRHRRWWHPNIYVCFSAANLPEVGRRLGPRPLYVVADHDLWSCPSCRHRWDGGPALQPCPSCGHSRPTPPTGEHHASKLECPIWTPPAPGDANDYHQAHGIPDLARVLVTFRFGTCP